MDTTSTDTAIVLVIVVVLLLVDLGLNVWNYVMSLRVQRLLDRVCGPDGEVRDEVLDETVDRIVEHHS